MLNKCVVRSKLIGDFQLRGFTAVHFYSLQKEIPVKLNIYHTHRQGGNSRYGLDPDTIMYYVIYDLAVRKRLNLGKLCINEFFLTPRWK